MPLDIQNGSIAFLLCRLILGILFFMQAYDKIFVMGMKKVVDAYELPGKYMFPNTLVWAATIFTSYIELICGPLVFLGLFTNYALYFLGLDMVLVILAFSALNPVWDMKFVFPRLVLILVLLLLPAAWNNISLDFFWFSRSLVNF